MPGRQSIGTTSLHHPRKRSRPLNPLQAGIRHFATSQQNTTHQLTNDVALPKRYTLYSPLLLLPVNFATHNSNWVSWFDSLEYDERTLLFANIAKVFTEAGQHVSHIALNAPIIAALAKEDDEENVLRSPSGLIPVLGDFGPPVLLDQTLRNPSPDDFEAAFWITTAQDHGIKQTWAPRWTMFSHGNLSEKRRILEASPNSRSVLGDADKHELRQTQVLDLYVGIGYFALCYLARGVKRVIGWDLNPWSVEGLRRGCESNGWSCAVVRVSDDGNVNRRCLKQLADRLVADKNVDTSMALRCVAFVGDNRWTAKVLGELAALCDQHSQSSSFAAHFQHVNLGLLPSSSLAWPQAVRLVGEGGTLHVHENVGTSDIDRRKTEIEQRLGLLLRERQDHPAATIKHVEQVKTYAPGVMHCVFDVRIVAAQA
jgi:tRNA wybutosine-synthesizing protein 2